MKKRRRISKKLRARRDRAVDRLEEMTRDPDTLEKCEEFHKKVSSLTPAELLRRFRH